MVEIKILSDFVEIWYIGVLGNCELDCISYVAIVTMGGVMEICDWSTFRYCLILLKFGM